MNEPLIGNVVRITFKKLDKQYAFDLIFDRYKTNVLLDCLKNNNKITQTIMQTYNFDENAT